jgi:predicted nucleic acid-binding protein
VFLLDTNVLSDLRRRNRANPGVTAWIGGVAVTDLFLSAITILEIEIGMLLIDRRDPAQGLLLRAWIDTQVLPSFVGRILPVDAVVAQRCAVLHVPDPRAERDALIAATALVHRLTVVTRNVADFQPMGVDYLDPFT